METSTEIRPRGLPITIRVPNGPRLAELLSRQREHEERREYFQAQLDRRIAEGQKLDHKPFSPEVSTRLAQTKSEIASLERQIAEQEFRLAEAIDEYQQWQTQIASKLYRRSELWREYGAVIEGPPSDSIGAMIFVHDVGESEKRTKGDVRRDLIGTLRWLLGFNGHDPQMAAELKKLQMEV